MTGSALRVAAVGVGGFLPIGVLSPIGGGQFPVASGGAPCYVSGGAPGYATVYPVPDSTVPMASGINRAANGVVPSFTIADTAGSGKIDVFADKGDTVNLVIDVFGYFTDSGT